MVLLLKRRRCRLARGYTHVTKKKKHTHPHTSHKPIRLLVFRFALWRLAKSWAWKMVNTPRRTWRAGSSTCSKPTAKLRVLHLCLPTCYLHSRRLLSAKTPQQCLVHSATHTHTHTHARTYTHTHIQNTGNSFYLQSKVFRSHEVLIVRNTHSHTDVYKEAAQTHTHTHIYTHIRTHTHTQQKEFEDLEKASKEMDPDKRTPFEEAQSAKESDKESKSA